MKNKAVLKIAVLATTSAVCTLALKFSDKSVIRKHKDAFKGLPSDFTVTSHSGSMNTKDNSIESITVGAKYADIIEFDLHFNKNGEAVLSHDSPVGGEVTLDEAFQALSKLKGTKANVDIKSTDNLCAIEKSAQEYGVLERIFLTGVGEDQVSEVKRQCPSVPYYLNVLVNAQKRKNMDYLLSLVKKVQASGAVGINMHYSGASEKLVEVFHENGLLVSFWTVNRKADMFRLLSYSPDNITTKKPDSLKRIIIEILGSEKR